MELITADKIIAGDIIVTADKGEYLVLRVLHHSDYSRIRLMSLTNGIPSTKTWRHSRSYRVDRTLSVFDA